MNSLYGNFRNFKFTDVWDNAEDFVTDYKDCGLYTTLNCITDDNAELLFYLLYARYGNSVIASSDVHQFGYKVFATIFQYGPAWEKNLSIQKSLRDLQLADIIQGSTAKNKHAFNPSNAPSSSDMDYWNEQVTTEYSKSKLDGYALLTALLEKDVTEDFLSKFKKLFLTVVEPEKPLWYITDLITEEN